MSVRLSVGDVVLVKPKNHPQCIGLIKYIGPMVDHDMMTEYIGIELLKSIPHGHNGTIEGFTYFTAIKGHGFHTKITKVIKKLSIKDLFTEMRQLYDLLQKQMKRVSRLQDRLNHRESDNSITPPKIDTTLPSLSPNTVSGHSNYSFPSRLSNAYSSATPLTTYSHNTSYKNIPNINPQKLPLQYQHSNSSKTNVHKNQYIYSPKSVSSNDDISTYCSSESKEKPIPKTVRIEQEKKPRNKNKKHKKKSSKKIKLKQKNKIKIKPKLSNTKLRRSQSHQSTDFDPMSPNSKRSRIRQHKQSNQKLTRQRSKTTHVQQNFDTVSYAHGHGAQISMHHFQNMQQQQQPIPDAHIMQYTNPSFPHANPTMSQSKSAPQSLILISQSAPNSPYNGAINAMYKNAAAQKYLEVMEHNNNNMGLQQSNTQTCDESNHSMDITYSPVYSHSSHTPSNSLTPNNNNTMLMVNNAYAHGSPYGSGHGHVHHYKNPSQSHSHSQTQLSHISHGSSFGYTPPGPTNAHSHSPFTSQLAAYNEYYRRGSNMSTHNISPITMHNQNHSGNVNVNGNANKMYVMHNNGHEIVYQHK